MNRERKDAVAAAAQTLYDAKPWETLEGEDFFGFVHPPTGLRACVSVIGSAGQTFGLSIWMGDGGFEQAARFVAGATGPDEMALSSDLLSLTFERGPDPAWRGRKDPTLLAPIRAGKRTLYPSVWRKPAGRMQEAPDNAHALFLEALALAIPRLIAAGRMVPAGKAGALEIPAFTLPADPGGEILDAEPWRVSEKRLEPETPAIEVPEDVRARLRLRRATGEVAVSLALVPMTVQDDPVRLLIVASQEGLVLDACPMLGPSAVRDSVHRLLRAFSGLQAGGAGRDVPLPEVIIADTPDLHRAIEPVLAPFGVTVLFESPFEPLDRIKDAFVEKMLSERPGGRMKGK
ncbi:MAG: hypothetical protein IT452_09785 [Planctomycetia bacterium]|nr:hypothetical protein [Planctomycetia bacterium]